MTPTTRRGFLQAAAGATATAAFSTGLCAQPAAVPSGSARRRYALIGCGGNGSRTAPVAMRYTDLVAFCDVDARHLERVNRLLAAGKADTHADYREVLTRDDVDVVGISTPDHWHTKIAVEAMLAGKDVYCEKPLTLTIDEGKAIRRVQRETGRVVQVGTQQRSSFDKFNKALAVIADGRLGKLRKITTGINAGAWSPVVPVADVPEGFDWDRWLGPAPKTDYRWTPHTRHQWGFSNAHVQFRWWYQYSGGKLTDWGAHHIDIAMLGIAAAGQNSDPVSVDGTARHEVAFVDGLPAQDNRYNTAREFDLTVAFADGDVEINIRHDVDNGILFEGERGRLFVNRGKLVGKPIEELAGDPLPEDAVAKVYRGMPMVGNDRHAHWANFVWAMDNRALPISDVHSHMKMLNVCHLAGICARLGRKVRWDPAAETIVGDEVAAGLMKRPYREGYAIEGLSS